MGDLVTLINEVPLVSTFRLFSVMGYREHRMLKKVIKDNKEAFLDLGLMQLEVTKPTKKEGGRPTESYMLNEDHFILLVLLAKNTPESVKLKIRVSKEFKRLKQIASALVFQRSDPNWQYIRSDGKVTYKQKTDVIKAFVDYATSQGSKSAKMYYISLAKLENNSLFFIEQKYKNLREILTIKQLMQVCTADDVVDKALTEGMEQELDYHDIYKLVKSRLVAFAGIIGKSQVQGLLTNTNDRK
jgi:hypothetical protein